LFDMAVRAAPAFKARRRGPSEYSPVTAANMPRTHAPTNPLAGRRLCAISTRARDPRCGPVGTS